LGACSLSSIPIEPSFGDEIAKPSPPVSSPRLTAKATADTAPQPLHRIKTRDAAFGLGALKRRPYKAAAGGRDSYGGSDIS
jgi:hypothetical protein